MVTMVTVVVLEMVATLTTVKDTGNRTLGRRFKVHLMSQEDMAIWDTLQDTLQDMEV